MFEKSDYSNLSNKVHIDAIHAFSTLMLETIFRRAWSNVSNFWTCSWLFQISHITPISFALFLSLSFLSLSLSRLVFGISAVCIYLNMSWDRIALPSGLWETHTHKHTQAAKSSLILEELWSGFLCKSPPVNLSAGPVAQLHPGTYGPRGVASCQNTHCHFNLLACFPLF